jgi:hypothetical protein
VRKHLEGLKVFGGIVLNSAVGGINPDAVNWMWRMQGGYGRVVWFPTFDADNHHGPRGDRQAADGLSGACRRQPRSRLPRRTGAAAPAGPQGRLKPNDMWAN